MKALACLALLLAAALAGCSSTSPDDQDPPAAEATAPQPVAIDERLDLTVAGASDSWSFVVAPNATTAKVTFTLEGPDGAPAHFESEQPCLTWTVRKGEKTTTGSSGSCGGVGNVNVAIGAMNAVAPRVLLDWDLVAEPGSYTFDVDAGAGTTVAVLHAVATVTY
jgi:hypothetical protein